MTWKEGETWALSTEGVCFPSVALSVCDLMIQKKNKDLYARGYRLLLTVENHSDYRVAQFADGNC